MNKQAMTEHMRKCAEFTAVKKAQMIDRKLEQAMATCPLCAQKNSVRLQLVPRRPSWDRRTRHPKSPNAHSKAIRWACTATGCGAALME